MRTDTRILNLTRNTRLKPHQASSRIAAGVAVWVERGISLRECTLAEVLANRQREPEAPNYLNPSELFGLHYEPPIQDRPKLRERFAILAQTRQFFEGHESHD